MSAPTTLEGWRGKAADLSYELAGYKLRAPLMEEALRALVAVLTTIEVLGEWEALDVNPRARRKERAKVDAVIAQASAALAAIERPTG